MLLINNQRFETEQTNAIHVMIDYRFGFSSFILLSVEVFVKRHPKKKNGIHSKHFEPS